VCEELVRRPMVITYLSSPSKVAKAIAILAQCVTIRLYTPKCSDRCDFLKLSLCLWEKNFGGLGAKRCALAESALDCVEARGAEGNITVKLSSLKGNQH
jgi:hypothetical protein